TAGTDHSTLQAGAAHVFVRSGSTWTHQAWLKPSNAEANDQFGYAVDITGDTIVVGAPDEASSQTWVTNGSTASSDNAWPESGAVYVFGRTGSIWSQQAYLKAPSDGPPRFHHMALSLAADGDTVVAGSLRYLDGDRSSGAVQVFVRSGSAWS